MLTIIIFAILLLFMGFVMPKFDSTWPDDIFHFPLFMITLILGLIIIMGFHASFFSGSSVVIENGEYNIIPIVIGKREGYVVEYCNKNNTKGALFCIEKDGLIIPLNIQYSDKIDFIEDGKCTVESKNIVKENKLWLIGREEFCESINVHIPPGTIIKKYGKEIFE